MPNTDLATFKSSSGDYLTRNDHKGNPIYAHLHKFRGEIFIVIHERTYCLSAAQETFFCCAPWEPYDEYPAEGWKHFLP